MMKKLLKYILEALKWALVPITFPLVFTLFGIGCFAYLMSFAAIALFDKMGELEVIPLRLLYWLGAPKPNMPQTPSAKAAATLREWCNRQYSQS